VIAARFLPGALPYFDLRSGPFVPQLVTGEDPETRQVHVRRGAERFRDVGRGERGGRFLAARFSRAD
jgi:hypothetical protein